MPIGDVSSDKIMSILDGGGDAPEETPPVEEVPPAPEGGEEEAEEEEAPEASPEGVEPTDEPEEAPPEEEAALEEAAPEGEFDPEIGPPKEVEFNGKKEWHFKPEKGRMLYEAAKEAKAFKEIIATPEEAREAVKKSIDLDAMHAHFTSGEPDKVDAFISYWGRVSPDGMAQFANRFVERARTEFPEAYDRFGEAVTRDLADYFYREAAKYPKEALNDPSTPASTLLNAAQMLDYLLTGQYKTDPEQQVVSPLDARLQEVQAREEKLQKEFSERQRVEMERWDKDTMSAVRTSMRAEIATALDPIKHLEKEAPITWGGALHSLSAKVEAAIKADQVFRQRFNLRYEQALRTRSPEDRKALVEMYAGRVRRAVAAAKAEVITAASREFTRAKAAQNKRLATAASRKEVSPGGPANPPKVTNPKYDAAKKSRNIQGMIEAQLGL